MTSRTPRGPAATRIAGPRADRSSATLLAGLAFLLLAPGCTSNAEEQMLATQKANSKHFYDAGDYARAEQVARKGLEIGPGDETLELTLAFSLLLQGEQKQLEEAHVLLEKRLGWFGTSDWRVNLGLGMTEQQLARGATKEEKPDVAADLRVRARDHLEKAREQSAKDQNTPPELYYHLCLLDLDEQKREEFRAHATSAVEIMTRSDKVFAAELTKPMTEKGLERTERDRDMNRTRARQLLRDKARFEFDAGELELAAASMKALEGFGELTAADYFGRGRIREKLRDLDGAVSDFEHFLAKTENSLDDHVTKAVESLTRLRAELAERRTAPRAAGQ